MKRGSVYLGGRKRRTMRGGVVRPSLGGRKRRTMRGGGRIANDTFGGRKRRTMRGGVVRPVRSVFGGRKRRTMRGGSYPSRYDPGNSGN